MASCRTQESKKKARRSIDVLRCATSSSDVIISDSSESK